MSVDPTEHFHTQVRFVCPFCKRKCSAGFTCIPGQTEDEGNPGVLHELPTCPKFDALEIDDFLHEVNIQYGGHN